MLVQDIMTTPARSAHPLDRIADAAWQMRSLGIGVLPVVEDGQIAGILTDRDLAMVLAHRERPLAGLTIAEVMERNVICCQATDTIEKAAALMGDHQVRRLPVTGSQGQLVGLLSVTDIAVQASERLAGEALGEIAEFR